jgi:hypothetical protein
LGGPPLLWGPSPPRGGGTLTPLGGTLTPLGGTLTPLGGPHSLGGALTPFGPQGAGNLSTSTHAPQLESSITQTIELSKVH